MYPLESGTVPVYPWTVPSASNTTIGLCFIAYTSCMLLLFSSVIYKNLAIPAVVLLFRNIFIERGAYKRYGYLQPQGSRAYRWRNKGLSSPPGTWILNERTNNRKIRSLPVNHLSAPRPTH